MAEETFHVIIFGRVQGVWFRGWTKQQATRSKLKGWVRNRTDGTVEAIFQGRPGDVKEMLELCETGPPAADVARLESRKISLENFIDFRKLPTL